MAETQARWEYCRIEYGGWLWQKQRRHYALSIWYFGNGTEPVQLAHAEDDGWDYDPLPVALFQLGHVGWELVSTQHSNIPDRAVWIHPNHTKLDNEVIIFYFKRQILEGRAIDQPALELKRGEKAKGGEG